MSQSKVRSLVPRDMYVLEAKIFREFFKEFGYKAIPVIERIVQGLGTAEAQEFKAKRNLSTMDVKDAAIYLGEYFKNEGGESVEVEVMPGEVHWKISDCACDLKAGDDKTCPAIMKGDEAMLNVLCNGKAKLTVNRAIGFGDKSCDVVITKATR